MRAVVVREHGGLEQLRFEERPVPEPGPGEVRVALRAIGLNHLDTWVRRGVPGHRFPLPIVPGSDGAGVVAPPPDPCPPLPVAGSGVSSGLLQEATPATHSMATQMHTMRIFMVTVPLERLELPKSPDC